MAEGKRNNNFWYWVIGTLIVLGLIWWWASASIDEPEEGLDDVTPEEVGIGDEEEEAYLKDRQYPHSGALFIPDFPRG
ncbi:hypothetical protein [Nafulsella turpanensis]|uniref:hypothetical protein n=1 Tax=Nafulsella turpanensis TaxID=1265690 RepID=UPI00034AC59F|nr:hypothetical protein [Nafulsella turpanensis]